MNDTHIALIVFSLFFILAGCASIVPSTRYLKTPLESSGFGAFDPLDSPIAAPYAKELASSPSSSGAMLIADGSSAFLQRAALVRKARFSLEIQTYIYKNDIASRVLMHEIWLAANRGVKVKMLVDDNGLDSRLLLILSRSIITLISRSKSLTPIAIESSFCACRR